MHLNIQLPSWYTGYEIGIKWEHLEQSENNKDIRKLLTHFSPMLHFYTH